MTIDAIVDPAYTGEVTNVATVTSATTDPDPSDNTDRVAETPGADACPNSTGANRVVVCPTLSISKVASTRVAEPGDTVTYTITVINRGPSSASPVRIVDELDPALTLLSARVVTGRGEVTTTTRTVTALFAGLAPDALCTIKVVARLDDDAEGRVPNVAVASTQAPEAQDPEVKAAVTIAVRDSDDGETGDDGTGDGGSGDDEIGNGDNDPDTIPDTGLPATVVPLAGLGAILVIGGVLLVRRGLVRNARRPDQRA